MQKDKGMEEFRLESSYDSAGIRAAVSVPQGPAKGIIQLVHGMSEHKQRYYGFMEWMSSHGYVCAIHDHRGHGSMAAAGLTLGHFGDAGYEGLVMDTLTVNGFLREKFPGLKVLLLGHSMGSMVARSFIKRFDTHADALIVCGSPSRNPAAGLGKLLAGLYPDRARPALIQKLAFEGFNRKFGRNAVPNEWICSDRKVVEEYNRDSLCGFTFTANGFRNLFALMQDCYGKKGWAVKNPQMPILFISGEDDPCMTDRASFASSVDFLGKRGYTNVSSILYRNMRHEILNEQGKEKVWGDILKFAGENI